MVILNFIQSFGKSILNFLSLLGRMACFLSDNFYEMFRPPFLWSYFINQLYFIGVNSLLIIILTGVFTGMVLTLQVYYVLATIGAEAAVGSVTAISLIRELGPVISALMVTGRAGSAITARIGIMRITDQIDALDAMSLNPLKYLTVPNIAAALIAVPLLNAIFILVGIWGGHLVGSQITGLSSGTYYGAIADSVVLKDLLISFYKSFCFGLLIAWISTFKGFFAGIKSHFGAEGVSKATTETVVLTSVSILIADYIITSLFLFI